MKSLHFLLISTVIALSSILLVATSLNAGFYGRFDIGFNSYLPDESYLEDRFAFTERFHLGWNAEDADTWSAVARFRLKEEPAGEAGPHYQIWDLRMNYGLDRKLLAGSAGLCTMTETSGLGSVMGGHLQVNHVMPNFTFGFFGGANPVIQEGQLEADGARLGAYMRFETETYQHIGIGYVSVDGSDEEADDFHAIEFDTQWRFCDKVYFYQSGEYALSKNDQSALLRLYFAGIRYDMSRIVNLSMNYYHMESFPSLRYSSDLEFFGMQTESYYNASSDLSSDSISPRIDIRLPQNWRVYFRYRYRDSEYFEFAKWHQYLAGITSSDLFQSGLSLHAAFGTNDGENKDYSTGFLSISRDFGKYLSTELSYYLDRNVYSESQTVALHVEDTQRIVAGFMIRFTRQMNLLFDYERSLGDDFDDHRLMFNFQYRL